MATPLAKLKSTAQLSKATLGSAALRLVSKEASRQYLIKSLSDIPGLPTKAAQLFSMKLDSDAGPSVASSEAKIPLETVEKIISQDNPALANTISELHPSERVASIGQVHEATLKDGRIVAIKVQLPDVAENLEAQIDMLFGASKFSPLAKKGLDLGEYKNFFKKKMQDETDYLLEINAQNAFFQSYSNIDHLLIPKPYPELSTRNILVQQWVNAATMADQPLPNQSNSMSLVATALMEFIFQSTLKTGLVHTDLQPGNLGIFRNNPSDLVLFDFGSNMKIDENHRGILVELITNNIDEIDHSPFDYLVALGFDPKKLGNIADRIGAVCKIMFEPFTDRRRWSPNDWRFSNRIKTVLGTDSWWFRSAGPPWFLLMMRSYHGALTALAKLDTTVNLTPAIDRATSPRPKKLDQQTVPDMSRFAIGTVQNSYDCADSLVISVTSDGKEIVKLSMPARAVDNIEELIPPETLGAIKLSGTNLGSIKLKAQSSGYCRQTLFELTHLDRFIKVTLC